MANRNYAQGQDWALAGSGILASDTSITLQSMQFPNPNSTDSFPVVTADIGAKGYGVLEPETPREENISFTGITQNGDGSATLTGVTRGLRLKSPYTADATLAQAHAGATTFRISNTAPFYNDFANKQNDEEVAGAWTFDQQVTVPVLPVADTDAASKKYVDDVAVSGAPDATTTTQGLVQLATQAQNDAGTAIGSTGAALVATPDLNAATVQDSKWTFASDAQASDAYAITLVPAIAAYVKGQQFSFTANTANTGPSSLNVNGKGAKVIKKNHDQDTETGDIEVGSVVLVEFDGTNFQMLNQQASMPTTAELTLAAAFFNTPLKQGIKTTLTATRDFLAGDALSAVSANHVERSGFTSFASFGSATTTNNSDDFNGLQIGQRGLDLSSTLKIGVYMDNTQGLNVVQYVVDPTGAGAITSVTETDVEVVASSFDICKIDATTIILCTTEAGVLKGRVISGLGTSISVGAAQTIVAANAAQAQVQYVSDADVLFIYKDSTNEHILLEQCTRSTTTLTPVTNSTVVSNGNAKTLISSRFFGATLNVGSVYQDSTAGEAKYFIGLYDTGTHQFSSVGTLVGFGGVDFPTAADTSDMVSVNDTTMVLSYAVSVTPTVKARTITRVGVVASVNAAISLSVTIANGNDPVGVFPFNARTVLTVYRHSTTQVRFAVLNVSSDFLTVTEDANSLYTSGTPNQGAAAGGGFAFRLNPAQCAYSAFSNSAATDRLESGIVTMGSNYQAFVGIASANTLTGATDDSVTNGYQSGLSGLTVGGAFVEAGGLLVTDANGQFNRKFAGTAISTTEFLVNA